MVTIEVLEGRLGVDDEGELARFVRVGYPGLVAALGLVAGDRGAAEDAVQEALARAVRAEGRGQCIELKAASPPADATGVVEAMSRRVARRRQRARAVMPAAAAVFIAASVTLAILAATTRGSSPATRQSRSASSATALPPKGLARSNTRRLPTYPTPCPAGASFLT